MNGGGRHAGCIYLGVTGVESHSVQVTRISGKTILTSY